MFAYTPSEGFQVEASPVGLVIIGPDGNIASEIVMTRAQRTALMASLAETNQYEDALSAC